MKMVAAAAALINFDHFSIFVIFSLSRGLSSESSMESTFWVNYAQNKVEIPEHAKGQQKQTLHTVAIATAL